MCKSCGSMKAKHKGKALSKMVHDRNYEVKKEDKKEDEVEARKKSFVPYKK